MTNKTKSWSQSLSVSSIEENYDHSYMRIALIGFTILAFLLSLTLNVINAANVSVFGFEFSSNKIINNLQTDITPSSWFMYSWVIIFVWQFLWLAYGVTTIFRKSSSDYLYKYPPVMHWLVYLNFSVISVLNIVCLVLWSLMLFRIVALYFLIMSLGLYLATLISMVKLSDYQRELFYTEKLKDIWSIRFLVQNGMILYAGWSFVMFLIALNLSLVYEYKLAKETTHLIIMSIILLKLIFYFLVENYYAYNYCKFLFTTWLIYAAFIFDTLITQILVKNKLMVNDSLKTVSDNQSIEKSLIYSKLNVNFLLHTCLISVFFFLFVAKLIKFVWKECCDQKKFSHAF